MSKPGPESTVLSSAGGETSFFGTATPRLLRPTKGAAAVWWGLFSDGSRDSAVGHGGCPVIAGSKWIVNKWVNTFEQFREFPCSRQRKVRVSPWTREKFW